MPPDARAFERISSLPSAPHIGSILALPPSPTSRPALFAFLFALSTVWPADVTMCAGSCASARPRGYVRGIGLGRGAGGGSIMNPETTKTAPWTPLLLLVELYTKAMLTMGDDEWSETHLRSMFASLLMRSRRLLHRKHELVDESRRITVTLRTHLPNCFFKSAFVVCFAFIWKLRHPYPRISPVQRIKEEVQAMVIRKAEDTVPLDELVISKKAKVEEEEEDEGDESDESEEEEWQHEAAAQLAAEASYFGRRGLRFSIPCSAAASTRWQPSQDLPVTDPGTQRVHCIATSSARS
ncbi:hypothetical protein FPV67DRAFT_1732291 [Lyophyllum atratum]|nr:hypothetical protein FPV67DRAFT_1732291 [Lyophyllum atratum]